MADTQAQPEAATPNNDHRDHNHPSWWQRPHTRHVHGDPLPGRPLDRVRLTLAGPAEDVAEFAHRRFVARPRSTLQLLILLVWLTLMAMWGGYIAPFTPITIVMPAPAAQTHRPVPVPAAPAPDPSVDLGAKLDALNDRLGGIEGKVDGVQGELGTIKGDVGELKARPVAPAPKKGLFGK